ncbi:hypothetical protein ANCCEY_05063, partial [Ancylostoma ceylanicum]
MVETNTWEADPCEDFYQFACGKWIESIPEPDMVYDRRKVMYEDLLKENQAILKSKEFGDSRAMTSAQRFHEKCVSSDEEWKSKGGSINFVIRNIRGYGYFPLIDGMLWEEQSFDLTMLLAYFNRNKTVHTALVPMIEEN